MGATRRGFLLGLGALIAAPAVVKVSSIMPVRVPFDQRMVWSVYGPSAGASAHGVFRMPYEEYATSNPTVGTVVTGEGEFYLYGTMASVYWAAPVSYERVERVALTGVELQRYEALDLPRVELLRMGDRVVDKRIIGGIAQELPKTVRATWGDDGRWTGATTAAEAIKRDLAGKVPIVGPAGALDYTQLTRAEIEARHQRSTRARRQAADVLERAKLATEQRRQALDVAAEAARSD